MTMPRLRLNVQRYLTFELGRACPFALTHTKCPIGHPERYRFGQQTQALSDDLIFRFWHWARYDRDFRGIIMWHAYNEPYLQLARIRELMVTIKSYDSGQPFQLFTAIRPDVPGFDLIKFTDYDAGKELDDRILSAAGEGKPYEAMQPAGWCGRGWGWELLIDYYGNWCLCCNDWRCEEAIGNIWTDDWDDLLQRYAEKAKRLRWRDRATYEALPRMCRACLDVNPNLHRSGASF